MILEMKEPNFGNGQISRGFLAVCLMPMHTNKMLTFDIRINNLGYNLPVKNTAQNMLMHHNTFR